METFSRHLLHNLSYCPQGTVLLSGVHVSIFTDFSFLVGGFALFCLKQIGWVFSEFSTKIKKKKYQEKLTKMFRTPPSRTRLYRMLHLAAVCVKLKAFETVREKAPDGKLGFLRTTLGSFLKLRFPVGYHTLCAFWFLIRPSVIVSISYSESVQT